MRTRTIKKNRDEISQLGFGAMRLPSKNGKIDREEGKKQIYHGIDNGINIIDTAAMYGNGDNEKFLGEILQGEYKDKVKISTKLPAFQIKKYEEMEKTLDKQLERLQRDTIDYYLLHNIDLKTMKRLIKKDVFKFLEKAKKDGKIKYVGFSYHGKADEFPELVDLYDWDVAMIQYNYFDDNAQINFEGIKHASDKGMGIFVMEPLKGGILGGKIPQEAEDVLKKANPKKSNAQWSFEWILNHAEITCVFSGMNTIEQIDENISCIKDLEPHSLSLEEMETIEYVKRIFKNLIKINCATCGYCMPCPQNVNIPECMKVYNEKFLFNQKGLINRSLINYFTSVGGVMNDQTNAGLCNSCRKCLRKCPQHLDIPKELSKVQKEFEGHFFGFKLWFIKHIGMPIYQKFF
ncbi:MAG: aldo/keto reductase [Methanobrevibacter sp.]|uniref:aldo/keto reductase n=1 Tax=Methanobrevibacter sp. TaxID=66852 RepID=UPI0026DFA7D7|nr:aldo/keto reductase [Methanobrevibacter sp.]MDO5849356.1 aldo/keto reductase [Methanobrevibacter sp.]